MILIQGQANVLVDWAERIGQRLAAENLSTSQLRNIFGAIRQIEMRAASEYERAWSEIVLLRPKMAYQAKRALSAKREDRSEGLETLRKILERGIILVGKNGTPPKEQFEHLVNFCEAIVAYHTRYGKK